jgi:spore coat polysaccharide biosynthesis protein SpsF
VLKRVHDAAVKYEADIIVDLTGDCPLVDPAHIDELVSFVDKIGLDYASNIRPRCWPDGFDAQVYTRQVLTYLHENVHDPAYRTHTGWNMSNPQVDTKIFNTYNLIPEYERHRQPEMRLTLDYAEDLEVITNVIKYFVHERGKRYYSAEDIIDYVQGNPKLLVNRECEAKKPGEG